jgi:hypothetical protein
VLEQDLGKLKYIKYGGYVESLIPVGLLPIVTLPKGLYKKYYQYYYCLLFEGFLFRYYRKPSTEQSFGSMKMEVNYEEEKFSEKCRFRIIYFLVSIHGGVITGGCSGDLPRPRTASRGSRSA